MDARDNMKKIRVIWGNKMTLNLKKKGGTANFENVMWGKNNSEHLDGKAETDG